MDICFQALRHFDSTGHFDKLSDRAVRSSHIQSLWIFGRICHFDRLSDHSGRSLSLSK